MAQSANVTIILGSPASGKTTLARRISVDLSLPILSKDDIKEALFDVLGSGDRASSRLLSEAAFSALARLARTQLAAGQSCILEGNWRATHAAILGAVLTEQRARAAQIWCRAEPREIVRRFTSRERHAGHLDELLPPQELAARANQPPAFMELGGPQWVYSGDVPTAYDDLLHSLKSWRL
jgi:predicted kinase